MVVQHWKLTRPNHFQAMDTLQHVKITQQKADNTATPTLGKCDQCNHFISETGVTLHGRTQGEFEGCTRTPLFKAPSGNLHLKLIAISFILANLLI